MLYNATRKESIQTSPYVALYGVQPQSPLRMLGEQTRRENEEEPQIDLGRHELIRESITEASKEAQLQQKRYYDSKRREQTFKPLDLVKVKNHASGKGLSKKLQPKWDAPCIITQLIEHEGQPVAARILNIETGKRRRAAFSDILYLEEREQEQPEEEMAMLPGELIQNLTAEFSRLSDPSMDELVDISHTCSMPVAKPISTPLVSPTEGATGDESFDEIARPDMGSQILSANHAREDMIVPSTSDFHLPSQHNITITNPAQPVVSQSVPTATNLPTVCGEESGEGDSQTVRIVPIEAPVRRPDELSKQNTDLINPTGIQTEKNNTLSDLASKTTTQNISQEQQQCSTPLAQSDRPPVSLEVEATRIIPSTAPQVSTPFSLSDQSNSQSRPRRHQKAPERYQP